MRIRLFLVLLIGSILILPLSAQEADTIDCNNADAIISGLEEILNRAETLEDLNELSLALRLVYERCDIAGEGFIYAPLTPITDTATTDDSKSYTALEIPLGNGYVGDFWQVYFTTPSNTRDRSQYVDGLDIQVAAAVNATENTLDIAAFELNNEAITEAIVDAHERGVQVRIVTDDEHGIEDDDSTLIELELVGIPIVNDERSALMHNKFMIMDSQTLWMGSMNYTVNGVYRNNNNMLVLTVPEIVATYQFEFDEMFLGHEFGPRSADENTAQLDFNGTAMEVYFASENEVVDELLAEINNAQSSIRFMTFSFTRDDMGEALLAQAQAGIDVQGVFETTGSRTQFSEMPRLFCAGVDVRQDGNRGILHHKVFIIDESTVITGSFNFSNNAVESNDENVIIIRNAEIAGLYLEEFARVQSIATAPEAADISCDE